MMNYEEFMSELMRELDSRSGEAYTFQKDKANVRNQSEVDVIRVIYSDNTGISPQLYIQDYYDRYVEYGTDVVDIAFDILVAVFAVLGIYGTVKWLTGRIFGFENTVLAVEILTQRDAESADVLIRDALFGVLSLSSKRVVVLVARSLSEDPHLVEARKKYGVSCYVIEDGEEQASDS